MLKCKRTFRLERLEQREMMAGDVAAYVQNGNLYVKEASGQAGQDNAAAIYQLPNGLIRVESRGPSGQNDSLINGAAYQDFAVTGSLFVDFGGGNDLVVIGADVGVAAPAFNEVHINVAAPEPMFTPFSLIQPLDPFNLPDDDNVIIWSIATRGSMSIRTGNGEDWAYVANSQIGDGAGLDSLTINTGSGADTAHVKNLPTSLSGQIRIQTYASLAETDADVAWLEGAYADGDIDVFTGGGNDLIHVDNSSTLHDLNFDAGAGDDAAEITHVVAADRLMAHLGDGNDSLSIDYLWGNQFGFQGDGGVDRLTKTANVWGHSLDQAGWEYVNGRPVWLNGIGILSSRTFAARLA